MSPGVGGQRRSAVCAASPPPPPRRTKHPEHASAHARARLPRGPLRQTNVGRSRKLPWRGAMIQSAVIYESYGDQRQALRALFENAVRKFLRETQTMRKGGFCGLSGGGKSLSIRRSTILTASVFPAANAVCRTAENLERRAGLSAPSSSTVIVRIRTNSRKSCSRWDLASNWGKTRLLRSISF